MDRGLKYSAAKPIFPRIRRFSIPEMRNDMNEIICRYGFGLLIVVLASIQALGADAALDEALDRHCSTVDAIRTFHCRVTVKQLPSGEESIGEYWRSEGNFRCRYKNGRGAVDYERRDGVTTQLDAATGQPSEASISARDLPHSNDVWSHGLLSFSGRYKFRVGFKELLQEKGSTATARYEKRDGGKMLRVKVSQSGKDLEIWLDPQVNYLARYVKMSSQSHESEFSVLSFQECSPGIFFPSKVKCTTATNTGWEATFSEIEINKPLPRDVLTVRLPAGILVSDDVRSGMFRTDASGKPTLPATNKEGTRLTLSSAPPIQKSPDDKERPTTITEEEAKPMTRWLLPASIAFFAVASVIWIVRSIRRRRQDGIDQ